MSTASGDTMTTFDSPDLQWSDPGPSDAASPPAQPTATDAPAAPSPADATTPPAASASTPDGLAPPERGPIPLERHEAVLAQERQRATEADAKYQRVAWAEALAEQGKTPDQVREAIALLDGMDADPVGFLERFYGVLEAHPTAGPQVRSWAGRVLAGARAMGQQPPTPTPDDPEPPADFQDDRGTPFYSAPQLAKWQEWRDRRLKAEFSGQMQPLVEAERRRQADAEQRAVFDSVKAELDDYRKQPHFTEHEADIKAYLASKQWRVSLAEAYNHVLLTKVLPSLTSTAKADTLAALKTQAAASTLSPSSAAPVTPAAPKSFSDPTLKW